MFSLVDRDYHTAAQLTLQGIVKTGAEHYERNKVIPHLLPLLPDSLSGPEPETTRQIVKLLSKALRRERKYGRAGSFVYSLNRHIALAQAFHAEQAGLKAQS